MIENAARDLHTPENGLRMRLHWITKLGYGRDPVYTPYVNTAIAADAAAPYVYWYPGLLGTGTSLYNAELFGGRIRTDGPRHARARRLLSTASRFPGRPYCATFSPGGKSHRARDKREPDRPACKTRPVLHPSRSSGGL